MESTHVFTGQYFYGTGRRKTATARVRLYKGKDGKLVVNNQKGDHYFNPAHLTEVVIEPLKLTGMQKSFDVIIVSAGPIGLNCGIETANGLLRIHTTMLLEY